MFQKSLEFLTRSARLKYVWRSETTPRPLVDTNQRVVLPENIESLMFTEGQRCVSFEVHGANAS
jgi:hypothetical protein